MRWVKVSALNIFDIHYSIPIIPVSFLGYLNFPGFPWLRKDHLQLQCVLAMDLKFQSVALVGTVSQPRSQMTQGTMFVLPSPTPSKKRWRPDRSTLGFLYKGAETPKYDSWLQHWGFRYHELSFAYSFFTIVCWLIVFVFPQPPVLLHCRRSWRKLRSSSCEEWWLWNERGLEWTLQTGFGTSGKNGTKGRWPNCWWMPIGLRRGLFLVVS